MIQCKNSIESHDLWFFLLALLVVGAAAAPVASDKIFVIIKKDYIALISV